MHNDVYDFVFPVAAILGRAPAVGHVTSNDQAANSLPYRTQCRIARRAGILNKASIRIVMDRLP